MLYGPYVHSSKFGCTIWFIITNKRDCTIAVETNAITSLKLNSTTQTYINKEQVWLSNTVRFNIYLDESPIAADATYAH